MSEAQGKDSSKSTSATLRARILQAGREASFDWEEMPNLSSRPARTDLISSAAAREALRYVLELDEDVTKDRPPTNVIIAQALAELEAGS